MLIIDGNVVPVLEVTTCYGIAPLSISDNRIPQCFTVTIGASKECFPFNCRGSYIWFNPITIEQPAKDLRPSFSTPLLGRLKLNT